MKPIIVYKKAKIRGAAMHQCEIYKKFLDLNKFQRWLNTPSKLSIGKANISMGMILNTKTKYKDSEIHNVIEVHPHFFNEIKGSMFASIIFSENEIETIHQRIRHWDFFNDDSILLKVNGQFHDVVKIKSEFFNQELINNLLELTNIV